MQLLQKRLFSLKRLLYGLRMGALWMNFATRNPSDPTTASVRNDAWEAILGAAAAVLPADAVAEADADAVAHDVAVADDVAALPTGVVAEVAAEVVDSAAAA